MAFLWWNDGFNVGVEEMDKQHQEWLNILNSFYDSLNGTGSQEQTMKLLNDALNYTSKHFKCEEDFMMKIGYPKLQEQKRKHAEITSVLTSYKNQMTAGKMVMSVSITKDMKKWFNEHILHDDKCYGAYAS